jgi:hypothetical protein
MTALIAVPIPTIYNFAFIGLAMAHIMIGRMSLMSNNLKSSITGLKNKLLRRK